jgi:hypothetical protein
MTPREKWCPGGQFDIAGSEGGNFNFPAKEGNLKTVQLALMWIKHEPPWCLTFNVAISWIGP